MKVLNCGHITVWKDKCSLQNHSSLMESYNISNLFYRTLFALRIICLSVQLFIRRWIRRMQVSPVLTLFLWVLWKTLLSSVFPLLRGDGHGECGSHLWRCLCLSQPCGRVCGIPQTIRSWAGILSCKRRVEQVCLVTCGAVCVYPSSRAGFLSSITEQL